MEHIQKMEISLLNMLQPIVMLILNPNIIQDSRWLVILNIFLISVPHLKELHISLKN